MKLDPASWARELAECDRRQWKKARTLFDDLTELVETVRGVEDGLENVEAVVDEMDRVVCILETLVGQGLVSCPEDLAELRTALGVFQEVDLGDTAANVEGLIESWDALGTALDAKDWDDLDRDQTEECWGDVVEALEGLAAALDNLAPDADPVEEVNLG